LVRHGSRAAPLGNRTIAIAFLSALLAACATADSGPVADATSAQPAKAAAPRKAPSAPAKTASAKAAPPKASPVASPKASPPVMASPIVTSSVGSAKAEKTVDLSYKPALGSRWIGTSEKRETKTRAGQVVESSVVRERGEYRITDKLEK